MLFDVLEEVEAIEVDPIGRIRKMQIEHKIRKTMTIEERKKVSNYLKENHREFYRFLHIFFHSGARISELLRLRGEDIDLAEQRFKILMIKGKRKSEVWKTIKDVALPFWIELNPSNEEFIFNCHC